MIKTAIILLSLASLMAFEPKFMRDPAISPDGTVVCFEYRNDLWKVPFEGGMARRLTSVPGSASFPAYSPDGNLIAFNSNREGYNSVYYIPAEGGTAVKVLTGNYTVVDWFKDSEHLLLSRSFPFIGTKMFRVNIDGSGLTDLNAIGFVFADMDSENERLVFSHNGDPYRERMTGSRRGSIHLYDFENDSYTMIYDSEYTERYPVFSKTGKGVYFCSSDGDFFQIVNLPESEIGKEDPEVVQLTNFETWSARDISIARENDRMVFEFFDEIWKLDPGNSEAQKLDVVIREDVYFSDNVNDLKASSTDLISPSAKGDWIAFRYKYDLFAVPFEGGEVRRLTENAGGIGDVVIMDDNHTVYFTSMKEGEFKLFRTSARDIREPVPVEWSSDKSVNRLRTDRNRLFVYYTEDNDRTRLALKDEKKDSFIIIEDELNVHNAIISNDGNYVFYNVTEGGMRNRDIYIYSLRTQKKERLLSNLGWLWNLNLDPDEEFLFYNRNGTIYRSELKKLTEFHFEKDKWEDIFRKGTDKKDDAQDKKVSEFVKRDLREHETELISRPGTSYIVGFARDKSLFYINDFEDRIFLRKIDFEGKKDEVISEITGGRIESVSFNDSTSSLFYLQNGRIRNLNTGSKKVTDTPFSLNYSYNRQSVFKKVFDQIHAAYARRFYDPDMHGVDWQALREKFLPYLKYNLDASSFSNIVDEMIGKLNSSHTGYYPNRDQEVVFLPIASIGVQFDYRNRTDNGITLRKVYDNSILSSVHGISAGDVLLSIDGEKITAGTDIKELLVNKVDEKIVLEFREGRNKSKKVEIKGLSSDYMLMYNTWVNERSAIVDELSGGRVGYAHIRGMSQGPLNKFIDDLFLKNFDKEAIIIDIRFNGGGNVSDELINILSKRDYAFNTTRWDDSQMRRQPYMVWNRPSVLMINRHSFSDAEIFPALYREFGLGKIVGTPTSGGVIGTSPYSLIDGSSMRMPWVGWFKLDGTNLEGSGIEPDIFVDPDFNQILSDDDVELKKAVELMLSEIDN